MTAKGWIMGGNAESIWIKKDQNKVIFDIKIATPNGTLSAMNFTWHTKTSNETKNSVVTKSLQVGEGKKKIDFKSIEEQQQEITEEEVTENKESKNESRNKKEYGKEFEIEIKIKAVNTGNNYNETTNKEGTIKRAELQEKTAERKEIAEGKENDKETTIETITNNNEDKDEMNTKKLFQDIKKTSKANHMNY
jgi:hypothetical protein